jgi:hypothetical protein
MSLPRHWLLQQSFPTQQHSKFCYLTAQKLTRWPYSTPLGGGGVRHQDKGTATLQVLIDHDASINYVSERWCTPLYYAICRSKVAKLKLLLEHGVDPDVKSLRFGVSALDYANKVGRMDMYELMEGARRHSAP